MRHLLAALELSRLCRQQQDRAAFRQEPLGLPVERAGGTDIARRNRDQARGQRLVAAQLALTRPPCAPARRQATQPAQELDQDHERQADGQERQEQHAEAGLDRLALPLDDDVARVVGEVHRGDRQRCRDDEEQQEPEHDAGRPPLWGGIDYCEAKPACTRAASRSAAEATAKRRSAAAIQSRAASLPPAG